MNDKYFYIDLDNESGNRFDMSKFLEFSDNFDPLTSFMFTRITDLKMGGYVVVSGEEGRPDLLSQKIYRGTQFWWIIMLYNNLSRVSEIINGMEIRYPSLEDLDTLYFSLKLKEQANSLL